MAFHDQEQLGPFREVAGLVAPRAEDIALVVQVVIPVDSPAGRVVFPDHAVRQTRLAHGDVVRQGFRTVQIARLARRFERGQHRFARMHVGVLSTVAIQSRPVGAGHVRVQAMFGQPEALLHQFERFVQVGARFRHPRLQGVGIGEQHESEAVAVVGAVFHRLDAVFP
ncbi:hypothetical protein D3C72_1541050 [compost metagenome]